MSTAHIKHNLEKNFGLQGTDAILKYLSRIKAGITDTTSGDIDKVVKVIGEKIPSIQNRYKRLTDTVEDPMLKLKILCYIVKSVSHRLR